MQVSADAGGHPFGIDGHGLAIADAGEVARARAADIGTIIDRRHDLLHRKGRVQGPVGEVDVEPLAQHGAQDARMDHLAVEFSLALGLLLGGPDHRHEPGQHLDAVRRTPLRGGHIAQA